MAVHMNIKPGSYLEMTIPLLVSENGYTTIINGQLFHLDASSSLQYRSLVESETLEVSFNYHAICCFMCENYICMAVVIYFLLTQQIY